MAIPLPKLACPGSRIVVEQSHLDHPQSRHAKIIQDHPFNYMLDTIIPNCSENPNLDNICCLKFYEARIQVSSLIHKAFIEAFVKRGKLQLTTNQHRIDAGDVISLTPGGVLTLHLTKQSYQQLGVDGKPSQYCRKSKQQKYVVEVDLLKSCFQPGKKNYERLRTCLNSNHSKLYDVMFTWQPDDDSIASVSVSKYFRTVGYECKEMDLEVTSHVMDSITCCPVLYSHSITNDDGSGANYNEVWEWLGAVSCDIDVRAEEEIGDDDRFVSTYTCPKPYHKVEGVYKESVTGLISLCDIKGRLDQLRALSSQYGWCALTVHGFTDSPVSWATKEHGYLLDGDNLYTFIVFPDGTYWLFYGLGTYDGCP